MTEIVRLQDLLSRSLIRRFEKKQALAFSDVVGSTPYFTRFGDEAGRKLQQRHFDLIQGVAQMHGGRVVDTAGDGAFLCFQDNSEAVKAMVQLQDRIAHDNDSRPVEHRLNVRIGCHFGSVLTDGNSVSGDSVNFCARVSSTAQSGEIRLSQAAYGELVDLPLRLRSRRIPSVELKGIDRPVPLYTLDWHDPTKFPTLVRFDDGTEIPLPSQDVIRFGRLREQDGVAANDIVLTLTDPEAMSRISRWHFELHLRSTGYLLRSVSAAVTRVDGKEVMKGEEVPVRPGIKIRLGDVLTLELTSDSGSSESTFFPTR